MADKSLAEIIEYIPATISTTENMVSKAVVTAVQWNSRINQLITQGNLTALGLKNLLAELDIQGVQDLLRSESANMKHIRLNADGAIEVSADNITWVATASSGHVVLDKAGGVLPQRSRLKFTNSNVSDVNGVTVVDGVQGERGIQGIQGIQGLKGETGDKGEIGNSIIPDVDQNTGLMSFTVGPLGIAPAAVNVRGPQGPQGVQGLQGPIGPKGNQGIQGPQGIAGEQGPRGTTGSQGVQGETGVQGVQGVTGPAGLQGPKGDKGDKGVQGEQGDVGARGLQGLTGDKGDKGDTGLTGSRGPQGVQGEQGIQGLKGDKGDIGLLGPQGLQGPQGQIGPKGDRGDEGEQGLTGQRGIQGVQGPIGPQGLKGDKGTDGTSFAIKGIYPTLLALQTAHPNGNVGDAYAVGTQENNVIYNWSTTTNQWFNLGALQGPEGAQGIQGVQGIQGEQGVKGEQGEQGIQGVQGEQGPKGDPGEQGIQGFKGDTGDTGEQGIQGIQGVQGEQGEVGPKGDQGPNGDKGSQGDTGKGYYPQGTWITAKPYVNNTAQIDTVFYAGSSYFCKTSHTSSASNTPPNATYWGIMADRGLQGIQGVPGEQGIQGEQGVQGNQGVKGDTGIQGEQGEPGVQGDQGTQGIQGVPGQDGLTTSVNGVAHVNGAITVTQDNIPDGTTNKAYTTVEKNKLSEIQPEANKTTINNTLTSTSTTQALSANQGKELKDEVTAHKADIASQEGRHGIRYWQEKLEIRVNGEWVEFKSGSQYPVGNISNFNAKAEDKQVTLTWQDPQDRIITDDNGETLAISKWKGTKILRKASSYPANENDGVLVVDNGVRNQYESNGFEDTGLQNDEEYFYMAFPYTEEDVYTVDESNRVQAMPKAYVIYGVKIDTLNSNPGTALTYTDMAVGFTPAKGNNGQFLYGSWQEKFPFNQIKPCLLNSDLTVNYYLDPNDYTKKADGSASDITSGVDGDVMVEFPIVYWKFETVGTDLYVRYSDAQVDSTFKPLAHTRGATVRDKCYVSAYLGSSLSSKLRSLSGRTPTASQTIGAFRTLAQANGAGFDQMACYQILMLQVLFTVMFKNRDSQTALGRGYVDGNSAAIATGGTNTKGMFYGETTGGRQVKFCGIEDFWGNLYYFVDGLFSDASRNILIGTENFNDTGSGYDNYGQGATSDLSGYISGVQGGTETGFIVKATAGSATTYYADGGYLAASRLPCFGGYWSAADSAGAFRLSVYQAASISAAFDGARLLAL